MTTLLQAVQSFQAAGDVLLGDLGASSNAKMAFDATMVGAEGAVENENPYVVGAEFAVATLATGALIAEIGPGLLAAGARAAFALATVDDAALMGAGALVNTIIQDTNPSLFNVTSGDALVESTLVGLGGAFVGLAVDQAVSNFASFLSNTLSSSNDITTTDVTGPVSVSGTEVVIAQNDSVLISNGADAVISGNGITITPSGNNNVLADGGTDDSISLVSLDGSLTLAADSSASSSSVIEETINENSNGSGTFTDSTGDEFASYGAGQLTTSTIQINGNAIDTYNSIDQLLNNSQGISLGNSVSGILDQTYQAPSYNFSQVVVPTNLKNPAGFTIPTAVNDSGTIVGWFGNPVSGLPAGNGFIDLNGTYTQMSAPAFNGSTPPGMVVDGINDSGTIVGTYTDGSQPIVGFIDTNGTYSFVAIPTPPGSNNPYYPTELTGISNNGIIVGHYSSVGGSPIAGFVDNNGTLTTVSTPWSGTGAFLTGVNNSGVVVGNGFPARTLLEVDDNTLGGDAFVDNNGVFTQIIDPNAYSVSGPNQPTPWDATLVTGINDNGVIVGTYYDNNQDHHGFIYFNGSYATVNYPGSTETFINGIDDNNQIAGYYVLGGVEIGFTAALNGSDTLQTSTLEVTNSGTVDLRNLTQLTTPATINLEVSGDTVYAAANVETINGAGNDTFNIGSNAAAGDTINDSTGNNTLTAGNVSGLTFNAHGSSGNNTLTVQDTITNSTGQDYNNTLNASNTSGTNALTVGDGSYDLLRADFSTGNNTLTAGNGSDDYLNAQNTTGVNTLQVGNGNSNTLSVASGTKNNSLTAGNGTGDYLNAESSSGANTLTAGNGNSDTLDVSFSSGNNTVTAGGGNGDYMNAQSSTGNNTLTAGNGSSDEFSALGATGLNTFIAGAGNTTLLGGEGYTSYKFGSAFGQDTLYNGGSSFGTGASSVQGEIDFTSSSITYENLWFTQSGNDLVVQLLGTSDTITVKGWFGSSAGAKVQTFNANGLSLSSTAVASLVSAMATYQTNNSGFNPTTATSMPTNTALQVAITNAWPGSASTAGVSIAVAEADQSTLNGIAGGYKIADTAADVLGNISFLTSDISHIASITLTDSTTPTITLTPSQLSSDSAVLQEITSHYNLSVSGGFVVLGNNQHVDISGSNDTVIPGLNDNFGVTGTNTSIMVDSEDGIFVNSPNGIADPLAALGSNAVVGNGTGQTLSGGSGITVMVGNGGNNTFVAPGAATGGTVTVWGGTTTAPSGSNTVDYSSTSGDLEIVLGQGEGPAGATGWVANADTYQYLASLNDIDNVIGGSGNNYITANSDNDTINGGNGDDWLAGGSGNDTFIVGTGDNTINSGGGNNTYQFGSSFGQDTINNGYGFAAQGQIDFTSSSVTDEKLWFQQSGNDLLVDLLGTNDQIDVSNWFSGIAGYQVQSIQAGGLTLDTQVAQLVQAMATYATNNPSFNPATATSMPTNSALQTEIAAAWHH
jgi:hypothetical protein